MKLEWKRQEKEIYGVNTKPCIIDVPVQKYIIISGSGNPNGEIFSDKVAALFSVAYKIKMAYKSLAEKNCEITDYSVYPLEGLWNKASEKESLVKEELQYRIMIRQPDFITKQMFVNVLEEVKSKKDNPYLTDISFETVCDGKCIQVLHKGAFDDEAVSFELMNAYCLEHGYKRMGKEHREIYLNNANRTEKANLKTILRYKVTDIGK
ncbi:MAG TPA: GyrI-like domain-containing protein [Candidatus Scybalomonas excrementigallinarum]|nr:GyrI-like domain-containing protein [Candidatus Scybalomonas excrementigallinarum]